MSLNKCHKINLRKNIKFLKTKEKHGYPPAPQIPKKNVKISKNLLTYFQIKICQQNVYNRKSFTLFLGISKLRNSVTTLCEPNFC